MAETKLAGQHMVDMGGSAADSRSTSMASVSSEGSMETPLVEQEEIAVLTHDVRNFKDALGRMRKLFQADWADKEKCEAMKVGVHERLGEVLKILRSVLERYPALQSNDLLLSAGTLIQQVKGYNYEDHPDPREFFESIDQLALAFSSRVSEYLMGDLDTNISLSSSMSSKTKSCENVASDVESAVVVVSEGKKPDVTISTPEDIDRTLLLMEQGVDFALQHAKLWSKYAKDLMTYVEKRAHLQMEYTKNLSRLAMTVRPLINEESHLPFQSIYCTALDHDMDNSNSCQATCSLLLSSKFLEPLGAQRAEHEKIRKRIKENWHKEVANMHRLVNNLQKANSAYTKCQREWEQSHEEYQRSSCHDQSIQAKVERKRNMEEETIQKCLEAEATYKAAVMEANECHANMQKTKSSVLQEIRQLILQSDQVIKTMTVAYFQLQHNLNAPIPTQFQTLLESSKLYDPGTQYSEFVRRLPVPLISPTDPVQSPYVFEPYSKLLEQERKSTESEEGFVVKGKGKSSTKRGQTTSIGSDTDSITSSQSGKSHEPSPTSSRKLTVISSCDELSTQDSDAGYMRYGSGQRYAMSKAAETHTFRKLITPSRCRECDSYVYFHGIDCTECGITCHRKCLTTLAIQCGHKRLARKMNTFGVDLGQHLAETDTKIPHIITKCIAEIDARGRTVEGIYRVSGVKSKVEKLCQVFENGADLVDLGETPPNVIATVLKLYLRQLPEPLLTFYLYSDFVRIAKISDEKEAVQELRTLVGRLPRHHYLTLATLMHHLRRVASMHGVNKMSSENLGIVFGPTLLRTTEGSASLNCLVDTVHQTQAITLMIEHANQIFDNKDSASEKQSEQYEIDLTKHSKAGEEASDEDVPYFLLSQDSTVSTKIEKQATQKVYKGSLKGYQGLEGLMLPGTQGLSSDSLEIHQKTKKSGSIEVEKIMTSNVRLSERERERKLLGTQRTESSADSDYSFESHASSSVESRSPRELEECCETFSELPPQWCKRTPTTPVAAIMDSPSSSTSYSPDESENRSLNSENIPQRGIFYIPSSDTSGETELTLSRRTYKAEKVMSLKYSGQETEETSASRMTTASVSQRGSCLYSKALSVTTAEMSSATEQHTALTCSEHISNIDSDEFEDV